MTHLRAEKGQPPMQETVWKQRKGWISDGGRIKEITHLLAEKEQPPKRKMVLKKNKSRLSDRVGIEEITHLWRRKGATVNTRRRMKGVLTEAHMTFTAQKVTSRNSNSHIETKRGDSQCEEANGGHPNRGPYNIHGPKGHLPK